jgi:signal transduction histidine kinase
MRILLVEDEEKVSGFIVRGVQRAHRGRITVESTASMGSRFTVELPLDNGDEAKQ